MYQAGLRGDLRKRRSPHLFIHDALILTAFLFIFFLLISTSHAQQVSLAWNANTEPDLQAYRVYSGTASRTYSSNSNVGNITTCTISGLTAGTTYFFAVTALDCAGNESGYSTEVSYTVPVPAPPPAPAPPPEPAPAPTPTPTPTPEPEPAQELVFATRPYGTAELGSKSSYKTKAQSFKAIGTRIDSVRLALIKYRYPNQTINVYIKSSLTGTPLAKAQIQPSQVTSSNYSKPNWINVAFPTPAQVTKGKTYYLVLEVCSYNSRNYYKMLVSKNTYPDGVFYSTISLPRWDIDSMGSVKFGQ
jgi:hypothetical protein